MAPAAAALVTPETGASAEWSRSQPARARGHSVGATLPVTPTDLTSRDTKPFKIKVYMLFHVSRAC